MTKIPCEVIQDLLPSYADGLTSEETNKIVEEHLSECETCRNIYESMKETEKIPEEDIREIDFLKKTKADKKKSVLKAVAGVIAAAVVLVTCRIFVIGSTLDPVSVGTKVTCEENVLRFEGVIADSLHAVRSVSFREEGNSIYIQMKAVPASFLFGSGTFQETYEAKQKPEKVYLNGEIIYEDGENIIPAVREVMKTYHLYVGDASADLNTARAAGLYEKFGPFVNELQTEREPYGWTITLQEPLTDRVYQERQMEHSAAVLMAMTGNLSEVMFEYTADGEQLAKTITLEQADQNAGFPVKDAAENCALLQKLMK